MILHFEIFPDKLSPQMLEEIKNFPAGGLHLEAGVQSFMNHLFKPSPADRMKPKQLPT